VVPPSLDNKQTNNIRHNPSTTRHDAMKSAEDAQHLTTWPMRETPSINLASFG